MYRVVYPDAPPQAGFESFTELYDHSLDTGTRCYRNGDGTVFMVTTDGLLEDDGCFWSEDEIKECSSYVSLHTLMPLPGAYFVGSEDG